jgi:hypothetical protein
VTPVRIAGLYRARVAGSTVLYVTPRFVPAAATLGGSPVAVAPGANEVVLPLSFEPGDEVAFEVVADAP